MLLNNVVKSAFILRKKNVSFCTLVTSSIFHESHGKLSLRTIKKCLKYPTPSDGCFFFLEC